MPFLLELWPYKRFFTVWKMYEKLGSLPQNGHSFFFRNGFLRYFKAKIFLVSRKCKNGHFSTVWIARKGLKNDHSFFFRNGFLRYFKVKIFSIWLYLYFSSKISFFFEMGFLDTYFKAKIYLLSKKCENAQFSTVWIANRGPPNGHFSGQPEK